MVPAHVARTWYHLGRLSEYLQAGELLPYLQELVADRELLADLERAVRDEPHFTRKRWDTAYDLGLYRIVMYAVIRAIEPAAFVETGVLHGLTTHVMLAGFRRNGRGRLDSIDAPSYFERGPASRDGFTDSLPPGREPGWVVPDRSRPYWRLTLGTSADRLPGVLRELGTIDGFLHDSEHTHATMTHEFESAWEALRPGGLLVSDNIGTNQAFADFCRRVDRDPRCFPAGLDGGDPEAVRFGLVRK